MEVELRYVREGEMGRGREREREREGEERGEGRSGAGEAIHSIIIHSKEKRGEVFGDINGEARYIEYSTHPIPKVRIFPLKKLPAGYLSEREFVFLPVQPEVLEKMLHPLLISPYISELSVVHDTVYLRSLTPEALRSNVIRVRGIAIRNNTLVLRRGQRIVEEESEFTIKELDGVEIPLVESYRKGREVFKLRDFRIKNG